MKTKIDSKSSVNFCYGFDMIKFENKLLISHDLGFCQTKIELLINMSYEIISNLFYSN